MKTLNSKLITIAALAGFVSLTAAAAPVLDAPIAIEPIAPIEVAPVAPVTPVEVAPVKSLPATTATTLPGATVTAPNTVVVGAPASQNVSSPAPNDNNAFSGMTTKAGQCSPEDLATKMTDGTSVAQADALAAIKFWGSRISIGTCHADVGGLVSYEPAARENFLKAAIEAMTSLKRKGDYTAQEAQDAWANALAEVLDLKTETGALNTVAALSTMKSLATNCNILSQTLVQ